MIIPSPETIEADVLVVGGGLAGCWATLRASEITPRVILADKGQVARSGDAVFCHDILAPAPEPERDTWLKEMVEHAEYMCDQPFARALLAEEGERIRDLEAWGVPFEKDEKGRLFLSLGRGHINSRVVLCDCRRLMEVMRAQLLGRRVRLLERIMVTDLLTSDGRHPTQGRVIGAVGLHTRTGQLLVFKTKAVIVTTGITGFKLHYQYADNLTGDGPAMALRAGAELTGLEFSFSPRFKGVHQDRVFTQSLMPFQTQGAYLTNRLGERFMTKYAPERMERRSSCGLLSLATVKETWEGRGPVYFDMRHFSKDHHQQLRRILPLRIAPFDQLGIDLATQPVEIRPLVTYLGGGGVRIDLHGQASLSGLFAGGIGSHAGAAEWVSGAMLAICNVFGYRAGQKAAKLAQELGEVPILADQVERLKGEIYSPLERDKGVSPRVIFSRLAAGLLKPEYSIVKNEARIREMLAEIKAVEEESIPQIRARDAHELVAASEARNFIHVLAAAYTAALERKETRLTHYRQDYPYRDDANWIKWVVVKREDKGLTAQFVPAIKEGDPVRPLSPGRIPAVVKFL